MRDVEGFFDRHAAHYAHAPAGMQHHHEITARRIDAGVHGDVLSVGGIWKYADLGRVDAAVTVVDLSRKMLATCAGLPVRRVQCDATHLPFGADSFDHVVLPLVLHHVAGKTAAAARDGAMAVIAEAHRLLRRGGRIWISEFCLPPLVYATEIAAVPITRRLLAMLDTPLVVMHSRRFYDDALARAGFVDVTVETITPPEAGPFDWITPIIGIRFIKVPRFAYPVHPTLIAATRR
jgi:SAM-dependent methyltransferase